MPANRGREDLRCPFGCRQLHRRQQSSRRSSAYYRTEAGRQKKQLLNAKRSRRAAQSVTTETVETVASVVPSTADTPSPLALPGSLQISVEIVERSSVLPYVLLLFSLIGRQGLSRKQLLERLRERMRQHSLAHLRRRNYVVHMLHERPP